MLEQNKTNLISNKVQHDDENSLPGLALSSFTPLFFLLQCMWEVELLMSTSLMAKFHLISELAQNSIRGEKNIYSI